MSHILYPMHTYLAPALFNSKVKELKRYVPRMQMYNQFFEFSTNFLLLVISRILVMAYKKQILQQARSCKARNPAKKDC